MVDVQFTLRLGSQEAARKQVAQVLHVVEDVQLVLQEALRRDALARSAVGGRVVLGGAPSKDPALQ